MQGKHFSQGPTYTYQQLLATIKMPSPKEMEGLTQKTGGFSHSRWLLT